MIELRVLQNIIIQYYTFTTINFFINKKRGILLAEQKTFSAFNNFIILIFCIPFTLRIYSNLFTNQINVLKFLMQVCSEPLIYLLWVFGKNFGTPVRDIIELTLISYFVWYQNRNQVEKARGAEEFYSNLETGGNKKSLKRKQTKKASVKLTVYNFQTSINNQELNANQVYNTYEPYAEKEEEDDDDFDDQWTASYEGRSAS